MKNDRKNTIYPSVLVSYMLNKLNPAVCIKHDKALFKITNELEL